MSEAAKLGKRSRKKQVSEISLEPAPIELQLNFRKYMVLKKQENRKDMEVEDPYEFPPLGYDPEKVQDSKLFSDNYKKLTRIYILNAYPFLPENVVDTVMKKPENNSQFTLSIKYIRFGLKFKKDCTLLEGTPIVTLTTNRKTIPANYEEDRKFFLEASIYEYNENEIQKVNNITFNNLYLKTYFDDFSIKTFECCKCLRILEDSEKIVAGCNDEGHCFCKNCFIQEAEAKKSNPFFFQKCYANEACPDLYSMDILKKYLPENDISSMIDSLRKQAFKTLKAQGLLEDWEKCDNCGEYCPSKNGNNAYHMCRREECSYCKCRACGQKIHWGKECEITVELKQPQFLNSVTEAMNNAALKVCPWCNSLQIRVSGCNRIPCSQCHKNFCYICGVGLPGGAGKPGDPYEHFRRAGAECPLWSIVNNDKYENTDEYRAKEAGKKAAKKWRDENPAFAYLKLPKELGIE